MLKNSKLVKETEDTYHVELPSGHKMELDKKGLHEKAHAIIKNMKKTESFDDGGQVKNKSQSGSQSDDKFKKSAKEFQSGFNGGEDLSGSISNVKNFITQNFDDGGMAQASTLVDPNGPENNFGAGTADSSSQGLYGPTPTPSAGGLQQAPSTEMPIPQQSLSYPAKPASTDPYDIQREATKEIGNIEESEGSTESAALKEINDKIAKMPTQQDIVAKSDKANTVLEQNYRDKKIDPDHFWKDVGTGSKIAAGIGMLLGGFGAVAGQQNNAVAMIQNSIDRDIDAQKNDQSKAMTLWKMNREKLGSDLAADIATKNQLYTGVKYKLEQAEANAKGKIAKQNAQLGIAAINHQQQIWNQTLGVHATLAGNAGNGSEQNFNQALVTAKMISPEMAKDAEAKYIPGVGVAKVPATPEDRAEITNYDTLSRSINNAIDFQKNVAGTGGAWTPTNIKMAADIKNDLTLGMGKLNDMKRPPSPEIMKLYEEAIGNIGGVNPAGTVLTGLEGLKERTDSRKNSMMSNLGVKPFSGTNSSFNEPMHQKPQIQEGATVTNKKDNSKLIYQGGKWVPLNG